MIRQRSRSVALPPPSVSPVAPLPGGAGTDGGPDGTTANPVGPEAWPGGTRTRFPDRATLLAARDPEALTLGDVAPAADGAGRGSGPAGHWNWSTAGAAAALCLPGTRPGPHTAPHAPWCAPEPPLASASVFARRSAFPGAPLLRLAGDPDDASAEPHICRGID